MIRITPNKDRAKSIVKMISLLEKRIVLQDEKTMSSLIIADYYKIIKELATAIALLDGYKTMSHKELMTYIKENYCNDYLLDELRVLRNRVAYESFQIDADFLRRNKKRFEIMKDNLKSIILARI